METRSQKQEARSKKPGARIFLGSWLPGCWRQLGSSCSSKVETRGFRGTGLETRSQKQEARSQNLLTGFWRQLASSCSSKVETRGCKGTGLETRSQKQEAGSQNSFSLLTPGFWLLASGFFPELLLFRGARSRKPESLVVAPIESSVTPVEELVRRSW